MRYSPYQLVGGISAMNIMNRISWDALLSQYPSGMYFDSVGDALYMSSWFQSWNYGEGKVFLITKIDLHPRNQT